MKQNFSKNEFSQLRIAIFYVNMGTIQKVLLLTHVLAHNSVQFSISYAMHVRRSIIQTFSDEIFCLKLYFLMELYYSSNPLHSIGEFILIITLNCFPCEPETIL